MQGLLLHKECPDPAPRPKDDVNSGWWPGSVCALGAPLFFGALLAVKQLGRSRLRQD